MKCRATLFALAVVGMTTAAMAQTTYTWNVPTGDWATPASWDPPRNAPAANDILVFNGTDPDSTAAITVTGLIAQTIGELEVTGGAAVSFEATAASTTLTISGGADAFLVDTGSSLRLTGANGITLSVPAGSTGEIRGDVIFHQIGNGLGGTNVNRILAGAASTIRVKSGGTVAMAPTDLNGFGGFGSSAANAIIFESGSAHYQGAEKNGVRNGGSGSNPFALTAPSSAVVFEPGSFYYLYNGLTNLQGRDFANLVVRVSIGGSLGTATPTNTFSGDLRLENSGVVDQGTFATSSTTAGDLFTINGNLDIAADGPTLSFTGTPAGAQFIRVRGNVTIGAPEKFLVDGSASRNFVLDGTTPQTVDANFASVRPLIIENDVNLISPLAVLNSVTINSGSLTASGNGRLLVGAAVTVPGSYTGPLGSAERLAANGLNSATLAIPSAPVTFTITTIGTGATGVLVGWSETGTPAGVAIDKLAINRTWTLNLMKAAGYTGTLVLTYDEADLPLGINEAELVAARWTGSEWEEFTATSTIDTVANTVTVTGVTQFSDWTLIAPNPSSSVRDWTMFGQD